MAPTLYSQDTRSIAIQTPLGKDAFLLKSLHGEEGLSRLFRFELELLTTQAAIDFAAVVGQSATIGLRLADGTDRYINGIVSRLALIGGEGSFTSYRAEVVPWLWLLTRTTDCRVFQKLSVPAILEKIFKEHQFLNFHNRLQRTYAPREYCVQYRETDFNFVSRLMEQVGIYYFFQHENGKHTLVLVDSNTELRPAPEFEKAKFRGSRDGRYEADVITGWSMARELRPTKYTLSDYNFETPNTALAVQVDSALASEAAQSYEIYDYPGGYQRRTDGEEIVRVRIEEQETQVVTFHGTGTCRPMLSGSRFDLIDHPIKELNQTYIVTGMTHAVSESSYIPGGSQEAIKYKNTFTALPLAVPFRPRRVTPRPVVHGLQTAVVVGKKGEELWVDKHGRVKVQFHWDREGKRDENSSCWVRVSQNWAGKRWGAVFLPRVGQEVIVEFLEGDPDAPIITGRVYNGDLQPPYELPTEQTKTALKSSSTPGGAGFNEVRFDDKAGAEQLFIHGQRDLDFVIERQSREWIGEERHLIVEGSRVEQVGKDQHLKVVGDRLEETGGGFFVKAGSKIVIESGGEITLKSSGGFISVGPGGVTIVGNLVNINSGGSPGMAEKTLRAPNRAASASPGDPSAPGGPGEGPGGGVPVDPVELYRKALPPTAKISDEDRRQYELALAELAAARDKKDLAGMKAAQAKLDAILLRNGITPPAGADAAIAAVVAPADPTTGTGTGQLGPPPELGTDGKNWKNRGRFFAPRFVSMLSALRPARTEEDWRKFFAWAVTTGFNGVRVFGGALMWAQQTAEGARARLPMFLDLATEFGLAVEVTAITDSRDGGYDPKTHLAAIASIVRGRRNVLLELANEVGHGTQSSDVNNPDTLRRWGQELCQGLLWAVGSNAMTEFGDEVEPDTRKYFTGGGTYNTAHLRRDDNPSRLRRIREIYGIAEEHNCPAFDNERMGADEMAVPGRRKSDPNWFFVAGLLDRCFNLGGIHHSEAGLHAVLPGPVQQACANAEIEGGRLAHSILGDAPARYWNEGFVGGPIADYSPAEWLQMFGHEDARAYSFTVGNRGLTVMIGLPSTPLELKFANGWTRVRLLTERKAADGRRVEVWEITQT